MPTVHKEPTAAQIRRVAPRPRLGVREGTLVTRSGLEIRPDRIMPVTPKTPKQIEGLRNRIRKGRSATNILHVLVRQASVLCLDFNIASPSYADLITKVLWRGDVPRNPSPVPLWALFLSQPRLHMDNIRSREAKLVLVHIRGDIRFAENV